MSGIPSPRTPTPRAWSPEESPEFLPRDMTYAPSERYTSVELDGPSSSPSRYPLRRDPDRPVPSVETDKVRRRACRSPSRPSNPTTASQRGAAVATLDDDHDWDQDISPGKPRLRKLLHFAEKKRNGSGKGCVIGFVPRLHAGPNAPKQYPVKGMVTGPNNQLNLYVYGKDIDGNELEVWDAQKPQHTTISWRDFNLMSTWVPQFRNMDKESICEFLGVWSRHGRIPRRSDFLP